MKHLKWISETDYAQLIAIVAVVAFIAGLSSSVHALESLDESEMSTVTGADGLGVQLNLQISSGGFQIKDNDGRFGGGAQGWLALDLITADISPTNTNDNTIFIDANSNAIVFSAPNPITGSLTIDEIEARQNRTSVSTPEIAAITIGDFSDGTASFNFHNTRLKIF